MNFRFFLNRPIWALVYNPELDRIVRVKEYVVPEVLERGWVLIARESWVLPFNPPRLIPADEPIPSGSRLQIIERPMPGSESAREEDGA